MGLIRGLARRVADRVADRVARDGLFEKPGERPRANPLPPPPPQRGYGERLGACRPAALADVKEACRPRGRPLLLHHWATWCEPCEAEIPVIERLHQAVRGHADVLGLCWDLFQEPGDPAEVAAQVAAWMAERGGTWPNLLVQAEPEAFFEGLGMDFRKVPQTLLLGPDGAVRRQVRGPLGVGDLDALVAAL